jgi:hypothetical protein
MNSGAARLAAEHSSPHESPRRFFRGLRHAEAPTMEDREQRVRTMVRRFKQQNPKFFDDNEALYAPHREAESIDTLVELAFDSDKKAFKLLQELARSIYEQAHHAGRDAVFPIPLLQLMVETFIYGEPKGKPGPKPTKNGQRDTAIARMILKVHEDYNFPLYGNVEGRDDPDAPMSAIKLVAEELELGFTTVEGIWIDRQEMVKRAAHRPRAALADRLK